MGNIKPILVKLSISIILVTTISGLASANDELTYTGGDQETIQLPDGEYHIEVHGARGGHSGDAFSGSVNAHGGAGGFIEGTLNANAESQLELWVGERGGDTGGAGGGWGRHDGGGGSNTLPEVTGGGGGSTEILLENDFLLAADGGGGASTSQDDNPGGGARCGAAGEGGDGGSDGECPARGGEGGDAADAGTEEDGEPGGQEYESPFSLIDQSTGGSTTDGDGEITITVQQLNSDLSVTTLSPENVGETSATIQGEINAVDEEAETWLQWRETGDSSWNNEAQQTITSSDEGNTIQETLSLDSATEYEFRIVAEFDEGLGRDEGETQTFETEPQNDVTTEEATDIQPEQATLEGSVNNDEDGEVFFEYKEQSDTTWIETNKQSVNPDHGSFSETIDDLQDNTDYEFRANFESTESSDTDQGTTETFSTPEIPPIPEPTVTSQDKTSETIEVESQVEDVDEFWHDELDLVTNFREQGGSWTEQDRTTISSSTTTTEVEVDGLEPDTEYEFESVIENKDDGEEEESSDILSVTTDQKPDITLQKPDEGETYNYEDTFDFEFEVNTDGTEVDDITLIVENQDGETIQTENFGSQSSNTQQTYNTQEEITEIHSGEIDYYVTVEEESTVQSDTNTFTVNEKPPEIELISPQPNREYVEDRPIPLFDYIIEAQTFNTEINDITVTAENQQTGETHNPRTRIESREEWEQTVENNLVDQENVEGSVTTSGGDAGIFSSGASIEFTSTGDFSDDDREFAYLEFEDVNLENRDTIRFRWASTGLIEDAAEARIDIDGNTEWLGFGEAEDQWIQEDLDVSDYNSKHTVKVGYFASGSNVNSMWYDTLAVGDVQQSDTTKTHFIPADKEQFDDGDWDWSVEYQLSGDRESITQEQTYNLDIDNIGQGSGTESDPYIVTSCDHISQVEYTDANYYQQIEDLNCGNTERMIEQSFSDVYDGQQHEIKNVEMDYDGEDKDNLGLFQSLSGGTVANLTLNNFYLHGYDDVGTVAGYSSQGTLIQSVRINNSIVKVNNAYAGGLVGYWDGGDLDGFKVENTDVGTSADSVFTGGVMGTWRDSGDTTTVKNGIIRGGTNIYGSGTGVITGRENEVDGNGHIAEEIYIAEVPNIDDNDEPLFGGYEDPSTTGVYVDTDTIDGGSSGDHAQGLTTNEMTGLEADDNMVELSFGFDRDQWFTRENDYPLLNYFGEPEEEIEIETIGTQEVEFNNATVQGEIIETNRETEIWFEYKEDGDATWTQTEKETVPASIEDGHIFEQTIYPIESDTQYDFKAVGQHTEAQEQKDEGEAQQFTTLETPVLNLENLQNEEPTDHDVKTSIEIEKINFPGELNLEFRPVGSNNWITQTGNKIEIDSSDEGTTKQFSLDFLEKDRLYEYRASAQLDDYDNSDQTEIKEFRTTEKETTLYDLFIDEKFNDRRSSLPEWEKFSSGNATVTIEDSPPVEGDHVLQINKIDDTAEQGYITTEIDHLPRGVQSSWIRTTRFGDQWGRMFFSETQDPQGIGDEDDNPASIGVTNEGNSLHAFDADGRLSESISIDSDNWYHVHWTITEDENLEFWAYDIDGEEVGRETAENVKIPENPGYLVIEGHIGLGDKIWFDRIEYNKTVTGELNVVMEQPSEPIEGIRIGETFEMSGYVECEQEVCAAPDETVEVWADPFEQEPPVKIGEFSDLAKGETQDFTREYRKQPQNLLELIISLIPFI